MKQRIVRRYSHIELLGNGVVERKQPEAEDGLVLHLRGNEVLGAGGSDASIRLGSWS